MILLAGAIAAGLYAGVLGDANPVVAGDTLATREVGVHGFRPPGETWRVAQAGDTIRIEVSGEDVGEAVAAGGRALEQGRFAEAETHLRRALSLNERALGPDHRSTLVVAGLLGFSLVEQRKYAEGEAVLRRVVRSLETQAGGRPWTEVAADVRLPLTDASIELGVALYGQKKFAEAEATLARARELLGGASAAPSPKLAKASLFLGASLYAQGRPADADPILREARTTQEKIDGPGSQNTAFCAWQLGLVLMELKKFAAAEAEFRSALAVYERVPGEEAFANAIASQLWIALTSQDKLADAEAVARRILAFFERQSGRDDAERRVWAGRLRDVLRQEGKDAEADDVERRYSPGSPPAPDSGQEAGHERTTPKTYMEFHGARRQRASAGMPKDAVEALVAGSAATIKRMHAEAERAYRQALEATERTLGADSLATAWCLELLGDALVEQHRYAEGEPFLRRSLRILESLPSPDPVVRFAIGRTAARLGLALYGQGKHAQAEIFFRRGLEILDPMFDEPPVASFNTFLGESLRAQKKYAEAERAFRRAFEIDDRARGPGSFETERALRGLAVAVFDQDRYAEAVPLLRRALAWQETAQGFGPDHPVTIDLAWCLGTSLEKTGRSAEAEGVFRRALASAEKRFGPGSEPAKNVARSLAAALRSQGKDQEAHELEERR